MERDPKRAYFHWKRKARFRHELKSTGPCRLRKQKNRRIVIDHVCICHRAGNHRGKHECEHCGHQWNRRT